MTVDPMLMFYGIAIFLLSQFPLGLLVGWWLKARWTR